MDSSNLEKTSLIWKIGPWKKTLCFIIFFGWGSLAPVLLFFAMTSVGLDAVMTEFGRVVVDGAGHGRDGSGANPNLLVSLPNVLLPLFFYGWFSVVALFAANSRKAMQLYGLVANSYFLAVIIWIGCAYRPVVLSGVLVAVAGFAMFFWPIIIAWIVLVCTQAKEKRPFPPVSIPRSQKSYQRFWLEVIVINGLFFGVFLGVGFLTARLPAFQAINKFLNSYCFIILPIAYFFGAMLVLRRTSMVGAVGWSFVAAVFCCIGTLVVSLPHLLALPGMRIGMCGFY